VPIVMRKRFTKATLNFTTCLGFGIMMCSSDYAIFTNDSAQKLLRDKFVLIMGRGAARIFLRGGLKLWKQKPCKGKIACD